MVFWYWYNAYGILDLIWMINHRNKQNYRFRTWKFRDRCHLKGGVRQGCFLSLILNNLIQYIHFHSLYITSHYYAKFKENPCVGTDARPPLVSSSFIGGFWPLKCKKNAIQIYGIQCRFGQLITFERTACLCCFGALSEREMSVKHGTNQMKRTRKYSGNSVNISALD